MSGREAFVPNGDQVCLKHKSKRVVGKKLIERVNPVMKLAMQGRRGLVCPQCDAPPRHKAPYVNNIKDPGHAAMSHKTPLKVEGEISKTEEVQDKAHTEGNLPTSQSPNPPVNSPSGGNTFDVVSTMEMVSKHIENFNVKDLTKFKKRAKLIKMLDKVKLEIAELIGGDKNE